MKHLYLLVCVLFSVSAWAQLPKGDRELSYSVAQSEDQEFDAAFSDAVNGCMEITHLQYPWVNYEISENNWNQDNMPLLDVTNLFFPLNNMALELNIGTMNTTVNSIPEDLLDLNYDSPVMISRFKNFLDTVFHHIPDVEISLFTIGNESDIYMGVDEVQFNQYKTFLDSVVPYAKELYFNIHNEELNVGTTLTREGLTNENQASLCQMLNQEMDIISTTYYPLLPGFQMDNPEVVHEHLQEVVDQYPSTDQPIYFAECGYASSAVCGSSEEDQAQFFREMFAAWDTQYDHIKSVSIFKTADWNQEEVDAFGEYYGIDDPAFLEYLRTLGTRTFDGLGTEKLAAEAIRCELAARDWCETVACGTSVQEQEHQWLKVYPNPSSESITLQFPESDSYTIKVFNVQGQEVIFISNLVGSSLELDVSELSSGQYHVVAFAMGGRQLKTTLFKQ